MLEPELIHSRLKRARRRALGLSLLMGILVGALVYLVGPQSKPLWLAACVLFFGLTWFLIVYRGLLGYCNFCVKEGKKLTYLKQSSLEQECEEFYDDPAFSSRLTNIHNLHSKN